MHRYLLYNDGVRETTEKFLSPGQVGLLNGWGVFSTLRVKDGVLFAWERHYARMRRDAELLHVPFPDSHYLESRLGQLIAANEAWDSTLRLAVVRNRAARSTRRTWTATLIWSPSPNRWPIGAAVCVLA